MVVNVRNGLCRARNVSIVVFAMSLGSAACAAGGPLSETPLVSDPEREFGTPVTENPEQSEPVSVIASSATRPTTTNAKPATVTPAQQLPPVVVEPPPVRGEIPGIWIRVAHGAFMMGSTESSACRNSSAANETQHSVTLTRDFEISETEVTQAQFRDVMGVSVSHHACGALCPADSISWHDAAAYANALSGRAGLASCYSCTGAGSSRSCAAVGNPYACSGYRLPTEAEWEYAYRAGTSTTLYNGDLQICGSLDTTANEIAWFLYNAEQSPHPVATKTPNAWGIHDMSGNVWEWTHDGYDANRHRASAIDPVVAHLEDLRVLRGGSYNCVPTEIRASHKMALPSRSPGLNVGFRLVRSVTGVGPS